MRAEVDQLRAMLAGFTLEVRTQRIVLTDGRQTTDITPGHVRLTHLGDDGEGTRVSIGTYPGAANLVVAQHLGGVDETDPHLSATLYAGSESDPGEAFLCVNAGGSEEEVGVKLAPATANV